MNVCAACRRLSGRPGFHQAVLAIIAVNALVMGLATWPSVSEEWGWLFHAVNLAVQALFVVEIVIRIAAHGRRPLAFFRDGWNVFDFAVVVLSLLPAAGSLATISRLARVLRVGRLVTGMPELRLIIGTMLPAAIAFELKSLGARIDALALALRPREQVPGAADGQTLADPRGAEVG